MTRQGPRGRGRPPRDRPARGREPAPGRGAGARGERKRSDLGARVLAAIPAIAFALFIVLSGGWIFTVGVALLGLVCLHELFRMYDAAKPAKLAGFIGILGISVAAYLGDERQVMLAMVADLALIFIVAMAMPDAERRTPGISITLLGVFWVGAAIAHAIMLSELPHGEKVIIIILVGTFIGDTGAYIGGRALGQRKLAPRISPNKTVEGLVIGMFTAVLATWCGGLYADWMTHGQALLLGVAVAILAPLGDLFESQVKRDAGTKDAGTLFGAHGGALDRLDAAFFALVAGYYVWLAMV